MAFLEIFVLLAVLILLAIPAGKYIYKVMSGQKTRFSKIGEPVEKGIYKVLNVHENESMNWKQYLFCLLGLSLFSLIFLWILLMIQGWLPFNEKQVPNMRWDLALNTAISYVTNTNWQAFNAENEVSDLVGMIGLCVQNFISAAMGISVLFALVRGFVSIKNKGIGNFFVDMTRSLVYILIPFSIVLAILLSACGVIQNFGSQNTIPVSMPVAVDESGNPIADAEIVNDQVYVDGKLDEEAVVIKNQYVPSGPAASQIAIKQLGSNGGGFYTANSAHPFENPNAASNLLEMGAILFLPMALVFSFGFMIQNRKQAIAIFVTMLIILAAALAGVVIAESRSTNAFDSNLIALAAGNMEGKEARFGIVDSSIFSVFTTASSNGSVNASMDSMSAAGNLICLLLMEIGEVVFGGVGCGLYTMLGFIILTVFISGLMVGRTPEFLGKKIEPFEMKWAVILCLSSAFIILLTSSIAALDPGVFSSTASDAHGFSQLLYAFSSAGANNGSAMSGFNASSLILNLLLALAMLFGRFVPAAAALAMAGSLAAKSKIASSAGTLSTNNGLFVFLLILIISLVGALSFFPALSLGPIAEMLG